MFAVAVIVSQNLVLSFTLNELQRKELVLDSSVCPATFEPLNALFIFVVSFEVYNLLNMKRNNCYLLLYLLLR